MRILFIHGRAQGGKNPAELKQIWIDTLKEGFQANGQTLPDNVAIDFPFYGDKLDELTSEASLDKPEDVIAKGGGSDKQYQEFIQSAIDEIKQRKKITDAEVQAEADNPDIQEKGIQNWEWVHSIANFLDKHFLDVSEFTIEKFLTDVYLYVNSSKVSKAINKIVEDMLTDEPTIVISHSLGTVVAYKVVMDNLAKLNIQQFITVGSPLGISAISSKLGIPENPAGDDGWYNAYDERDIVALNPLDDRYFPADPEIDNYNGVKNKTDNRHGIIGYLNDRKVAAKIAKALASETADSPFG
jgi:hypothetical protein